MIAEYKSHTWVLMVALSSTIGTLTYSFQINCMNDALKTMLIVFDVSEKWKSVVEGTITSSIFVGAFVGALICLQLLKISGRRAIIIIDLLLITGGFLCAVSNPYIFLVGRFLSGMGCGAHSIMVPVFLKQISPKQLFGQMVGLLQTAYAIGYMMTGALGLLLETPADATINDINFTTLRIYYIAPSIFSLIRIILFLTFVRFDSPQYYMEQDQISKAETMLEKIYKKEFIESAMDNLQQQKNMKDLKIDLLSDTYRLRFYLALSINGLYALCGVETVQQYMTTIFRETTSEKIALYLTFSISVVKLVSYSTRTLLSQKIGININQFQKGRRSPFLIGNGIMCVSLLGIGITSTIIQYMELPANIIQLLKYIVILLIFVYFMAIYNSISFLVSLYIPELVPGKGVAICFQFSWMLTIILLFAFPIFKQLLGISGCFFFFSFCTCCGQLILYKFALETINKNETEIDDMFDNFRIKFNRRPTQIQDELLNKESYD